MPRLSSALAFCSVVIATTFVSADDPVFSGPQPGEKLPPFQVVTVYGDDAGKEVDPVALTKGKPTLLVFIHKLSRPGIVLAKGLTAYANANAEHGATAQIIWLDDDKAAAEEYLNRARKSLNFIVPVGISVDGGEGPGSYGLNRNVEQTILIAKENKVAANFALVQPSVSEAGKIAAELAKLIDQPAPTTESIQKLAFPNRNMMRRQPAGNAARPNNPTRPGNLAGNARSELIALMRAMAGAQSDVELRDAVAAINQWVGKDKQRQVALARMSDAVLQRGIVPAKAQPVVKEWIEQFGPKDDQPKRRERPQRQPPKDESESKATESKETSE